jgi:outer membrane protein assembly factor BamB
VDALTFSADGTLYAGGWSGGEPFGGKLLKVDKATGAVLAVHPTTGGIQLSGLAFDAAGTLWASHGNNSSVAIHQVDVTTGAIGTAVQFKNVAGAFQAVVISDLAFGADGRLYASLPRVNALATIDLGAGATRGLVTSIGNFGSSEVRMAGLAIRR